MKLSITDKFLWDLYDALGGLRDALDVANPYRRNIISLIAPNTRIAKKYSRQQFSKLISYLKRKNYISIENLKGKKGLLITRKGIAKALVASAHPERRVKRKDGKWFMIMFDIPEKQRGRRDLLRSILKNLGYQQFQKSAWVTPYDVSLETEKLLALHHLDDLVKIFVIEEI